MKFTLKLTHNISLRLDCVKIKKYIYIALSHKILYMLQGTEFVFLFRIRRNFIELKFCLLFCMGVKLGR